MSTGDREAARDRVRRFLDAWDRYKRDLDPDAHDKHDDAVTELGMDPPYTELLASDLRTLLDEPSTALAERAQDERARKAILDIDAHATPMAQDDDGFAAGGYLISVGSLHRALGVVGHSSRKCRLCTPNRHLCVEAELQRYADANYLRDALVGIAGAVGVPVEAEYGPKANGILLDDILHALGERRVPPRLPFGPDVEAGEHSATAVDGSKT